MRLAFAAVVVLAAAGAAWAQDDQQPQDIPFEGGTLTVTATPEGESVLTYGGEELARNYVVTYDRTVEVSGVSVAMFFVGDGGNMCPPSSLLVWKPEGGRLKTETVGDDCGSPSPAATPDNLFFVPYVMPGGSGTVEIWTPEGGLEQAGTLTYAPQPGTSWKTFGAKKLHYILDAMKNADVYRASRKLLGDKLADVVTSLTVSGDTEKTPSGVVWGTGCVPHDCGGSDGFMGVDAKRRQVYFAQQGDGDEPTTWPALDTWPKDLREAMLKALSRG